MKWKCYLLLFVFMFYCTMDAYSWGHSHSRGGSFFSHSSFSTTRHRSIMSKPASRWKSVSQTIYPTGSKSSPVNVHQKLERTMAIQGKKYQSRSEALVAFRSSKEYSTLPTSFKQEPSHRPEYIPQTIVRDRVSYPIVFYRNGYGYYAGPSNFIPLNRWDYLILDTMLYHYGYTYSPYHSAASLWLSLVTLLIIAVLVIVVIYVLMQAFNQRTYIYKKPKKTDIPSTTEDSSKEKAFESKHPWLSRLYGIDKGKVVTLSDPLTLTDFGHPADFIVDDVIGYTHENFRIHHTILVNDDRREKLELHLFAKEVEGDFALFLGMLDHEGSEKTLRRDDWHHLEEDGDKFAESFNAVVPIHEREETVVFTQYEFGAFYDVVSTKDKGPIGLCEYYPDDPPQGLDWQHAIVTWRGDWLSCYYCVEVHEGNLTLY